MLHSAVPLGKSTTDGGRRTTDGGLLITLHSKLARSM
jgi:hypothetical protein